MCEWGKKSCNLSTQKIRQPINQTQPIHTKKSHNLMSEWENNATSPPKNITQPLLTKTHATSPVKKSRNLTKQKITQPPKNYATLTTKKMWPPNKKIRQPLTTKIRHPCQWQNHATSLQENITPPLHTKIMQPLVKENCATSQKIMQPLTNKNHATSPHKKLLTSKNKPSRWSSTNRQNPPLQENSCNFWITDGILMPFGV